MDAYQAFADVYDELMDDIDYEKWAKYIISLLKDNGVSEGILLELGCGTGNITEILAREGFDLIGVDSSPEMLAKAMEKNDKNDYSILYINQDMRELDLYGTVKAVVSACDSINYIINPDDLRRVFELVNNYLDPGGIFVFDFITPTRYEKIADNTIAENREDVSFIWENNYDPEERINCYDLTLFVRQGDSFIKFEERHFQRAYNLEEIRTLLDQAGLEYVTSYSAFTKEGIGPESERIYVIAREKGKEELK